MSSVGSWLRRPLGIATSACALVVVAAATVFGLPVVVLLILAVLPWVHRWLPDLGATAAAGAAALTAMAIPLLALLGSRPLGLDPLACILALALGVGAAGLAMPHGAPASDDFSNPQPRGWGSVAAACAGSAVWVVAVVLSRVVPGASSIAWATLNDAANTVSSVREIVRDSGILIGAGGNPVPLPAALSAAAALPGRWMIDPAELARHDVAAFVGTWVLLLAALCAFTGFTARALIPADRRVLRIVGPALASVVPLSWLVGGIPMEYGYLNVPLGLCLIMAGVLVHLTAKGAPLAVLAVLALDAALLAVTWSPLVLIPLLLALAVVIQVRGRFAARGAQVVAGVAAGITAVVVSATITLPTLAASVPAIGADVVPYPLPLYALALAGTFAVGSAVILALASRFTQPLWAVAAVLTGGSIAVGFFLILRRNEDDIWGYYPYKALGYLVAALVLLGVGVGFAAAAWVSRRASVRAAVAAAVAVAAVIVLGTANAVPGYGAMDAVSRVLTGTVYRENAGDEVMRTVFRLSDPGAPALLWRTTDPNEDAIDFWLLKLASAQSGTSDLHRLAWTLDTDDLSQLCEITGILGGGVSVYTDDPSLAAGLAKACPAGDTTVVGPG